MSSTMVYRQAQRGWDHDSRKITATMYKRSLKSLGPGYIYLVRVTWDSHESSCQEGFRDRDDAYDAYYDALGHRCSLGSPTSKATCAHVKRPAKICISHPTFDKGDLL